MTKQTGQQRIQKAFHHKAFIPFITCGDPDLATSKAIIRTLAANGADIIELGIPFSDPTAEGPVIQDANLRALKNQVTTDDIFQMVADLRQDLTVPMVIMTYANVVFSYGIQRFIQKAQEVGIDGLILPDVPYEEKEEFNQVCQQYGLAFISLIAPTSHERIAKIAKEANGFLYCVSSLGVTGVRSQINTDLGSMIAAVRKAWLWNCHKRTSQTNESTLRRDHHRIGHRQTNWPAPTKSSRNVSRICQKYCPKYSANIKQ